MEINGVSYTKKADAGATLLEQCKTLDIKESATIGRYRGFEMILSFDTVYKEYHLTLKGALSHKVTLGMDELGNITRIENVLEGLNVKQVASELLLDTTKSELESAREEIKRPFPKEDELSEKSKRLDSLNILLNMDNQTTDIVDASAPAEEHPRKQRDAHER